MPGPAVVVDEDHRVLAPRRVAGDPRQDRGVDDLVAVGEDVGLDPQGLADDPLHRRAAAVDLRAHRLDHHPALAVRGAARSGCRATAARWPRGCAARPAAGRWRCRDGRRSARPRGSGRRRRRASPPVRAISAPASTGTGLSVGIVEHDQPVPGRGRVAGVEAGERHEVAVGRRDADLRALDIGGRQLGPQGVDRPDRVGDVDAGVALAVARGGLDHVQRPAVAPLVADRHQHARREEGGERVAGAQVRRHRLRAAADLGGEPLHVVVLGEGDRGRQHPQALVLLQRPGLLQVPPREGVEQVVEAGAGRGPRLLEGAAQGLGGEQAGGVAVLGLARSGRARSPAAPCRRRHSGSPRRRGPGAAPRRRPRSGSARPGPRGCGSRARPDRPRPCGSTGSSGSTAAGCMIEPSGSFMNRSGRSVASRALSAVWLITRSVITDRPSALRGGAEAADLLVVRRAVRVAEPLVEALGIGHRVEAPRAAGLVERVEVDPVEAERGDPRQLGGPVRDAPDQEREQVVDPRPLGAGRQRGRQDGLGPGRRSGFGRCVHAGFWLPFLCRNARTVRACLVIRFDVSQQSCVTRLRQAPGLPTARPNPPPLCGGGEKLLDPAALTASRRSTA